MTSWSPIETIPTDRDVVVKTVSGIVCQARVRRKGGLHVRPADKWGQKRVYCFRKDGRTTSDIAAVAWREVGENHPDDLKSLHGALARELALAEQRAWVSLARYKFQMFGYWAAIWVHLNRVGGFGQPNPFSALVAKAREREVSQ